MEIDDCCLHVWYGGLDLGGQVPLIFTWAFAHDVFAFENKELSSLCTCDQ